MGRVALPIITLRNVGWRGSWVGICAIAAVASTLVSFSSLVIAQESKTPESWDVEGSLQALELTQVSDSKGEVAIAGLSMTRVRLTAAGGPTGAVAFKTLENGQLEVGILPAADEVPTMCRLPVSSDPKDPAVWITPGEKQVSASRQGPLIFVECELSGVGAGYRDQWLFVNRAGPYATWFYPNATHIFLTNAKLLGFQFQSDPRYPLTFKLVANQGYVHICGKGTVIAPDGTLRSLGNDDSIEKWLPLLKSKDQLLREGASQALGWLATTEEQKDKVVLALIEALNDSSKEVRRNAAEALGKIGDGRASTPLKAMVQIEKDQWVIAVAKDSLSRLE